jgi:hypothetical protein
MEPANDEVQKNQDDDMQHVHIKEEYEDLMASDLPVSAF